LGEDEDNNHSAVLTPDNVAIIEIIAIPLLVIGAAGANTLRSSWPRGHWDLIADRWAIRKLTETRDYAAVTTRRMECFAKSRT
jgi:hypothetical protein